MKNLQKFGGFAAFYLAAAYLIGIVIFVVILNSFSITDPVQKVALNVDKQMVIFSTNLLMYVFFGVFLITLSLALYDRLKSGAPAMMQVATAIGIIWAGSLIASGMVANAGLAAIVPLYATDPAQAALTWQGIEAVSDGLGNGNGEILGGLWTLLVSLAALRAGELTVLRGPSGAGKSTLLRVLLGLERPDSGTATLDHADLAGLDRAALAALRRRVAAYAGQDVQLAETVDGATNLDLARTVRGLAHDPALVAELLERLDLGALARRQVRLLSGGERQRVAVARALAVTPRLLVCDEPTSQLDEASAQRMAAVLRGAAHGGAAVVVATHDPVVVADADQVLDLG